MEYEKLITRLRHVYADGDPITEEAADCIEHLFGIAKQLRQRVQELTAERDELLKAAEAIEINAEECLDFDECTAMLVQIDDYHKLMEAIASVKEK